MISFLTSDQWILLETITDVNIDKKNLLSCSKIYLSSNKKAPQNCFISMKFHEALDNLSSSIIFLIVQDSKQLIILTLCINLKTIKAYNCLALTLNHSWSVLLILDIIWKILKKTFVVALKTNATKFLAFYYRRQFSAVWRGSNSRGGTALILYPDINLHQLSRECKAYSKHKFGTVLGDIHWP